MICPYLHLVKPVITFCEPNLCAYIVQPANAWSNLAFVIIGVTILYRSRQIRKSLLWWLGPITLFIGLASFAYHATYTFIGQMFDLGSMFLFSSLLIILNLHRVKANLSKKSALATYITLTLASLTIMYIIRTLGGFNIGIIIFALHIAAILILECLAWFRAQTPYRLGYLLAALTTASVAAIIWVLDYKHVWCDPNYFHYINGHAVWHILTAISLMFIFIYYKQFEKYESNPQKSQTL